MATLLTPDTLTSTFPERPVQVQIAPSSRSWGCPDRRSPTLAYSVVPHLFVEAFHRALDFLPRSVSRSLKTNHAKSCSRELQAHSDGKLHAGTNSSWAGLESSFCRWADRQQLAQMKSYTVRLSGLVPGKGTVLPLSRPTASFSGVYLDAAWSDAANLGTRRRLPHNGSHLTSLACERRSIVPGEPTCADKSPLGDRQLGTA